jgi:putative nucleotidyltransferase with HDIG domain
MYATQELPDDPARSQWLIEPMLEIVTEVQSQSAWTWKHLGRVARYAVAFGKKLGLDRQSMVELQCAAILHDVGKLMIPPELLDKTTRLTRDEWYTITKHPVVSSKMLKALSLPPAVVKAAQSHHEWYDGTGYPLGLQGRSIPLSARILSLADSYDAMSSDRPYRVALKHEEIMREIDNGTGTQFDPELVRKLRPVLATDMENLVPTRHVRVVSDDPMLYLQVWFAVHPLGWELHAWPAQWQADCPTELLAPPGQGNAIPDLTIVDGRCSRRLPEGALARISGPVLWVDPLHDEQEAIYRPLDMLSMLERFDGDIAGHTQPGRKASTIKVLIADPYQLFRQMLRRCLDEREDVQVVGEVSSPAEYRRAISTLDFQVAIVASDMLEGTSTSARLQSGDYLLDAEETAHTPTGVITTIALVADEDLAARPEMPLWTPGTTPTHRVNISRGEPAEVLIDAIKELTANRPGTI